MGSSRTIRVEMHCHTQFSVDGAITYSGLFQVARRRGLDAVCITDHDTTEGALEFQKQARRQNETIEILVGEERTLKDGSHLIGLFLKEPIASQTRDEVIAEVHAQEGMVLMPHPFRGKDGLLRDVEQPGPADFEGIDAFELFNAKGSYEDNERSRSLLNTPLGVFGGSDAHYESDVAYCVCEMPLAGTIAQSIRSMLHQQVPYSIHGIRQSPGGGERKYAPLYYKIKPYVCMPRPLMPLARRAYRWYRNLRLADQQPDLVQVYSHA